MIEKKLSSAEENYLKVMCKIVIENNIEGINSVDIRRALKIKAASVSNMLNKFKEKGLVKFERYGKVYLTDNGLDTGKWILRKHRIWETFLHDKLGFDWDEVHEVAEQLEHIHSPKLISALDKMLGKPKYDPHGEYIPQADGSIPQRIRIKLSHAEVGNIYKFVGIRNNNHQLTVYFEKFGMDMNTIFLLVSVIDFDKSIELKIGERTVIMSSKLAENIYVEKQ